MIKYLPFLVILCTIAQACQKEIDADAPLTVTDKTFLPLSIAIASPVPDENLTVSFKYLADEHIIEVYVDDTLTTNPYDKRVLRYFYNNKGYFTKREAYDAGGNIIESFAVQRAADNTLQKVYFSLEDGADPVKDTFTISFSDSASHKIMLVQNTYRVTGEDIEVTNRLVFKNHQLVKSDGGLFSGASSSIMVPTEELSYDAAGSLSSITSASYYGLSYNYATQGKGLDSFFLALGGVDGHYLDVEALWSFNSSIEFTFFPLYIILASNDAELYTTVHKHGLLGEVRSIPNGSNFPNTEIFNFQNTLDARQRVVQSDIIHNAQWYARWKIKYLVE